MDVIGSLEVRGIQGFTSSPIEFVDNNTICYTCGNHICFLNLKTKSKSLLQGPGRGIGAFTARGTSGIFAFSEQNVSPSIFVYAFPELHMKNELKGKAQLDYTSLALSDGGPYLGCCTSLPDHTITVWNWETAEPVCTQPQAGKDVISLVFNPMNWLQLCALGTASITVWNIEKSASLHVLKPCVVQLPASDGSLAERLGPTSYNIKGNKADTVVTKLTSGARLTPSAICWTTTSDLFVGCAEGFLFLVNPENLSVTVLFNPTTPDVAPDLADLRQSSFQGLTLNKNGVIAVMKDSVVHCLQIKGTQIDITQTWQIEGTATTAIYSPDYETLLLSSNTGQIYMLNSTRSDKIEKVLDILSGNFVAAAWSHSDKNICVSVRDSGELQLWTVDGMCRGSLPLQAEVTSVAYCPIAQYAAVGTKSGNVLFVDLNREQEPRLVHQVQLYHSSVDHLVFDQEGHHLLTGASDSNIYVIDAKPSKKFPIIGYTVVPGPILSLSTQCVRDGEQVKALALCARQEGNKHDSSLFTLPAKDLTGPDGVDQHGCPSPHVLKGSMNEVSHPLESCVLGVSKIFSYCHRKKTLQQFQLPQVSSGAETVDVLEQDESSNILLSAPPSHPTWLEGRQDAVMEEENQKYSEIKENLRKTIEELRNTIQEMRCENETLPAIERLAQQEFNLDVEDQRRQAAVVEQEVTRVRKEIEWEILVKCYFRDVLKRACWDSVKVKGRAIKSFHSEHEVKNYPLEERSEKEVEELRRVENIRKIEMAACTQCDLKKCSNTSSSKEEEQGEEDHTTENAAVTGSFSAQLGYSNPYIYNQFSLKTTEQRINQFILLQEKLKIAHLVCAVLLEEEMRNRELELKLELEKLLAHKDELEEKVKSCEEDVELFHKAYDTVAAEDKVLDKEFRKEFYDVPAQIVDHLYKLFRRRPRVQKLRTQTDNNPNPFKDQHLSSSQASDALDKMLKAMEELDAPENIPQGLNPSIWERFCLFRRSKIESEQKVKVKALALAEMQALLQKRRDETEAAEQEIKNLSDQRESLHKEKNSSLMDIMVQMVLKQSQVSTADVTAEDSDYELLHRSVVEELNKTIRLFNLSFINVSYSFLFQYLTKTARAGCTSKQVSILEKTIDLQKETHQHKVQNRMKEIEQLNKQAAMKAQSNKIIEQQLPDMQVTVAERRHINEAAEENQEPTTEESYLEIPQKKHLKDYARAQGEDLVVLRAELERLRMRTFPSLDELKH
nr:PREDICTED: cilia- and flagella-associated protein 43 [Paralichthys olivaceus]